MTETDLTLERSMYCCAFLENHKRYRSKIREESKSTNKKLLTAHQCVFSAVISYQNRIQGIRFETENASITGRMHLFAQFIQGVDITESAISEGLYAMAANLLKQELEMLAAMDEYEAGNRTEGKTPRFRDRLSDFGRRYGELNDVPIRLRQVAPGWVACR